MKRIIDTSLNMCDDAPAKQVLGCRLLCADPSLKSVATPTCIKSPVCISHTNDFDEWYTWSSFRAWMVRYNDHVKELNFQGDEDACRDIISIISSSRSLRSLRIDVAPERTCRVPVKDECDWGFLGTALDGSPMCDADGRAYLMNPKANRTINSIVKKSSVLRRLASKHNVTCTHRAIQISKMMRRRQHFQFAPLPPNLEHLSLVGCFIDSRLPSTLVSLSLEKATISHHAFPLPESLRTLRIHGMLAKPDGSLWNVNLETWGPCTSLAHFEWHGHPDIEDDRRPTFDFRVVASPHLTHFYSSHVSIINFNSSTLGKCLSLATLCIPNGLPRCTDYFSAMPHIPLKTFAVNTIASAWSGELDGDILILPSTTTHANLLDIIGNCVTSATFQHVSHLETLKVRVVHRPLDVTRLDIWDSLRTLVVPAVTLDQFFPENCVFPRTQFGPSLAMHMPIDAFEMNGSNERLTSETVVNSLSRIGHLIARLVLSPEDCEDQSGYYIVADEIKELIEEAFPHIIVEINDETV